jgi:hypothetical protein
VARDTGLPQADVENDFLRVRRRHLLAELAQRLRREPDDVNLILPFDEVIAALGFERYRPIGVQLIRLDTIVGTVDSTRDFDRRFRPTSARVRERWERLALAQRRGESMPPIDVYRIDDLHFVRDGHHRVSIALATGQTMIEADVTEVVTTLSALGIRRRGDLLVRSYERLFLSRVPLPPHARAKITVSDPWSYAMLGEAVEAWGFRYMQHEQRFCDRSEIARRWFADEYVPVTRMLRQADLLGSGTEAEAYMRVAGERYRLIRTHEWNDEIIRQLSHDSS